MILMVKKLLERFMKKNYKKQFKKSLEYKKYLKKGKGYGKAMIIHLIARLIKKRHCIKRVSTFLNHMNLLEETSMSKFIYVIMR